MAANATGISDEAHAGLKSAVRGTVITPADSAYNTARAVYNAMIDKRPAMVIRCVDVADVMAGVKLGADSGLAVAVRSGGHNAAGLGTCDGGIQDRGNPHGHALVRAWLGRYPRWTTVWLPPYTPELNPVELLWSQLKFGRLANVAPARRRAG